MNPSGDVDLQTRLREAARHHTVMDVGSQRVARVYAEALLNSAAKRGQEEEILGELQSLVADVFPREPKLEEFLSSPAVAREVKAELLQSTFAPRASEAFANFLQVLNQHDRLDLLWEITSEYERLFNQRRRRIPVEVRSAAPLTDDQRAQVLSLIHEKLNLEPVLDEKVDPSLLGGLVVRVGNWVYDASVRNKLQQIKNELIARGSHEIQVGRDRFSH
jgi:F-type H+-transporting ATPase subunit delta